MANIDLSTKFKKEEKTITLAEGVVITVNTSAENYLLVQEKFQNKASETIQDMYGLIEMLCGTDGLEKVKSLELDVMDLQKVIIAISALINEITYEEMEKRFQQRTK